MKIIATFFLLLFVTPAFAQDAKPTIDSFSWLAGCWVNAEKGTAGAADVTEQWLKPAGGMMMGMGRTVKDGKVLTFEFMRIYEEAGDIFFAAKLRKQEEVAFKLKLALNSVYIFENPTHDFPQRVIYRKNKDGSMTGRIEGKRGDKEMGFDFPMKRAACE